MPAVVVLWPAPDTADSGCVGLKQGPGAGPRLGIASAARSVARARVHADVFDSLARLPTRLDLSQRGWGAAEVAEFAEALPRFERCAAVYLSGNALGVGGAQLAEGRALRPEG